MNQNNKISIELKPYLQSTSQNQSEATNSKLFRILTLYKKIYTYKLFVKFILVPITIFNG